MAAAQPQTSNPPNLMVGLSGGLAPAIRIHGLTHRFSNQETVLRELDLEVPSGSIYGFLGPNGAGKSTTLRLVLGLLGRQRGTIEVLGSSLDTNRLEVLRQVGSSIESPSLYADLTATENLTVWQRVFGCPKRRIAEVLELVGLSDAARKRTGRFSLGMKQRLSIAIALLHEPRLLILDEPTNGLDPHGSQEVRTLLATLHRSRGTTIVVSSHLLSEVERLATHVGILDRGRLAFQGTLASLMAKQAATGAALTVDTNDDPRAITVLLAAGWSARLEEGKLRVNATTPDEIGQVNRTLVLADLAVHRLASESRGLESLFMDLIGS
jgi:ABC-type multidrug transport system ATPase subunit